MCRTSTEPWPAWASPSPPCRPRRSATASVALPDSCAFFIRFSSACSICAGSNQPGSAGGALTGPVGAAAVFLASINIFGGFTVTQRMLKMFRKA